MSTPTQTPKGKAAALPPAAEGSGTTHENEKVPEYDHTTENHGYPIDKKTAPALPPRAEVVDEKAAGTSTDIEAPPATAASPTSPNKAAVGTFADGAVLANPTTDPGATLTSRTATAESSLTPEARAKILKAEGGNSKQMSKILKSEGRSQDKLLKSSIKELSRLESVQKKAAKDESTALARHTKAVSAEQKTSLAFEKAKAAFEKAKAELAGAAAALDTTRAHSKAQTEALKVKTLEVEQATKQKGTDDREREVKLGELKAIQDAAPKSGFLCL